MSFIDHRHYPCLEFLDGIAGQHESLRAEAVSAIRSFSRSPEVYIQNPRDVRLFILPVKWQGRMADHAEFTGDRNHAWQPSVTAAEMLAAAPLLSSISHHQLIVNAMYSMSMPGCEIKPHTDRVEAIGDVWRVHVGLACPDNCGIECGSERAYWKDGGVFMFDSARSEHKAWNRSQQPRLIAIIDVDRRSVLTKPDQLPSHLIA